MRGGGGARENEPQAAAHLKVERDHLAACMQGGGVVERRHVVGSEARAARVDSRELAAVVAEEARAHRRVAEEADVTVDPLCGNGGAERAAKPGPATPVSYPFRVNSPAAPGRPTAAEACDRLVDEMNPDNVQGYTRVIESGGHKIELLDMNWEDG